MSFRLLWGKSPRDGQPWHPLACHLLDVGLVARELLTQPAGQPWVSVVGEASGWEEGEVLGAVPFLAALHDLGKASPTFQRRDDEGWARVKAAGLPPRCSAGQARHDLETYLALERLLPWDGPQGRFGRAVRQALGAHHGSWVPLGLELAKDADVPPAEAEPWALPWWQARRELVGWLAGVFLEAPHLRCPEAANLSVVIVLLNGLTILADWLGSNEDFFPRAGDLPLDDYRALAEDRARRAVAERGLESPLQPCPEATTAALFPDLVARPLQTACEPAHLPLPDGPFLAVIEAPTGEGKSEAALLLASRAADRFYVALPTQATSNSLFERVAAWLRGRDPAAAPLLVHGLAELYEAHRQALRLEESDDLDELAEPGAAVTPDPWLRGRKRALLAPYGVGTIDQVLFGALQVRHVALRLLGLVGKVVIVDEVHAYDVYLTDLLKRLLQWLAALGSTVILLSATLPRARRDELIAAYGGRDPAPGEDAYPLVTLVRRDGEVMSRLTPTSYRAKRTLALEPREATTEATAAQALGAAGRGACVAWIANTVAAAQEAFSTLRAQADAEGPELILLHAQMPYGQRREREAQVEARFGKASPADRPGTVLVATQVVEQSLDLDFDWLLTELAPVDLLLQRLGRLHRHEARLRPAGFEVPGAVVLLPPLAATGPAFGPAASVYAPWLLLRSWAVLTACDWRVDMPGQVRELVETVYGDGPVPLPDGWQAGWFTAAWEKLCAERNEMAGAAAVAELGAPDRRGRFMHQAVGQVPDDEAERDRAVALKTRFGPPSVRCILATADDPLLASLRPGDRPTVDQELALLERAVSLSRRAVVEHVMAHGLGPHPGWAQSGVLRPYVWLELKDGAHRLERGVLRLDEDLGVVVERRPKV